MHILANYEPMGTNANPRRAAPAEKARFTRNNAGDGESYRVN
jgi:hypothetical protein